MCPDLPALRVSCWDRTLCVLCLLLSLSAVFSGPVHVVASVWASLFRAEGRPGVAGLHCVHRPLPMGPRGVSPLGLVAVPGL